MNESTMAVVGRFDDADGATRAVQRLLERSVPSDSIRVYATSADGSVLGDIEVEDEAGVLRGALLGALAGGALGLLIVVLTVTGVLVETSVPLLEAGTLRDAVRVVLTAAAAGVPLGGIIGLGRWQGGKKIADAGGDEGPVLVAVTSPGLADTARSVLRGAGARTVEDRDDLVRGA